MLLSCLFVFVVQISLLEGSSGVRASFLASALFTSCLEIPIGFFACSLIFEGLQTSASDATLVNTKGHSGSELVPQITKASFC